MLTVGKSYNVQRTNYGYTTIHDKPTQTIPAWGRCIWIHPEGRFALIEFPDGIRECFKLIGGASK